jgi:hypothetical protein
MIRFLEPIVAVPDRRRKSSKVASIHNGRALRSWTSGATSVRNKLNGASPLATATLAMLVQYHVNSSPMPGSNVTPHWTTQWNSLAQHLHLDYEKLGDDDLSRVECHFDSRLDR